MKPDQKRGLVMVQSTSEDGSLLTHVQKEEIEEAGLKQNDRRFRQSNSTPLQHPVVLRSLGHTGCSAAATRILTHGEFPKEVLELDPFLDDYLTAHKVGNTELISQELKTASH